MLLSMTPTLTIEAPFVSWKQWDAVRPTTIVAADLPEPIGLVNLWREREHGNIGGSS